MRVLFVSPAAELGGAERCLLDCVAALRERKGVQVDALTLADGPLVGKIRELFGATATIIQAPAKLASLGESGSSSESGSAVLGVLSVAPEVVRFIARLREAIVRLRPDVVHTNGMKAHLLAGALAPTHSRLVIHLHDFIGARRASKWFLPALRQVRRRAVIHRQFASCCARLRRHRARRRCSNGLQRRRYELFCRGCERDPIGSRPWPASKLRRREPRFSVWSQHTRAGKATGCSSKQRGF